MLLLLLLLLLLLPLLLLLLSLLLLLADEAFASMMLPPAGGRGNDKNVETEEGDAWKDAVDGRNEDAAWQNLTARRSDLRVCVLVPLVSGGGGLLFEAQDGALLEASMAGSV